jgi:hypothetical protein
MTSVYAVAFLLAFEDGVKLIVFSQYSGAGGSGAFDPAIVDGGVDPHVSSSLREFAAAGAVHVGHSIAVFPLGEIHGSVAWNNSVVEASHLVK